MSRYSSNLAESVSTSTKMPPRGRGSRCRLKPPPSAPRSGTPASATSPAARIPNLRERAAMSDLLVRQVRSRRMVAAGDRGVAVQAGASGQPVAGQRVRRLVLETPGAQPVVHRPGVAGIGVALLAEERHRRALQLEVIRAVRRVAVQAALAHRRMLPKERPALLGVAGVALLVDRRGGDQLGRRRPVRIVAVGAADLALANRVMGGFPGLGAPVFVAGEGPLPGGGRPGLGGIGLV